MHICITLSIYTHICIQYHATSYDTVGFAPSRLLVQVARVCRARTVFTSLHVYIYIYVYVYIYIYIYIHMFYNYVLCF